MAQGVELILKCLTLGIMLGGFVLVILALRFRTPQSPPIPSFNPRHWIVPVWMQQAWFQPCGYKFNLIGSLMMGFGAGLALLFFHLF